MPPATVYSELAKAIQVLCQSIDTAKFRLLHGACNDAIQHLKGENAGETEASVTANIVFYPLKLACESRINRPVEIALDCIQKLVAHNLITGRMQFCPPEVTLPAVKKSFFGGNQNTQAQQQQPKPAADTPPTTLIFQAVNAICFNTNSQAEDIQRQVIRALLTLVSSPSCGVHGPMLMSAVRTTYNIFLSTKSVVIQSTAKAALSQIIGIVQQRMENAGSEPSPDGEAELTQSVPPTPPASPPQEPNIASKEPSVTGEAPVAADVEEVARAEEAETTAPADAPSETNGATESPAVEEPTTTQDATPSASPAPKAPARRESNVPVQQTLNESFTMQSASPSADEVPHGMIFVNQFQKDCFIVLKSLCKLAAKPTDQFGSESVEVKSKLLSLNLILNFLVNSDTVFRQTEIFTTALRQYLCISLLQNCVSIHNDVCKASFYILLQLIHNFRNSLKKEVAVFFQSVLFQVLESSNASFHQKAMVLESVILEVCKEPQTVADLFVNYDCSMGSQNVFEALMNRVSKVVQESHVVPNWITPRQDEQLRAQALKILVMTLKSMVLWVELQAPKRNEMEETMELEPVEVDEDGNPIDAAQGKQDRKDSAEPDAVEGVTDEIQKQRMRKLQMQEMLDSFRRKPKDGIALARKFGLLDADTPEALAKFIHDTKGLDKVQIGEVLGKGTDFSKATMKAYVDYFDFTDLAIDEAMRKFLGTFKIGGEAEIVDRTMEKLAERYCQQNPKVFGNADTAFILAFSIMMLNTDAHSPSVKEKMTLGEFQRNNRGINDGGDLPAEFLEEIYNRVTTREIKLKDDGGASAKPSPKRANPRQVQKSDMDSIFFSMQQKKELSYRVESKSIIERSREAMISLGGANEVESTYIKASNPDIVKPMWEVCWAGLLAAFSVTLEETQSDELVNLCLQGFDNAMKVCCLFNVTTQREAFISSLSKFTHLAGFREMHYKNIKSIQTMIVIASREGNHLHSSWYEVLKCISQLEKLHLIGSRAKPDFAFLDDAGARQRRGSATKRPIAPQFEQANAELIANTVDQVTTDKIFSHSAELGPTAVVSLVECLCRVSHEELHDSPPRMYSLQKLIEVADINISRIRFVWGQIWSHISSHITQVGLSKQLSVSMFAVDSLRQLAMKFLQREELSNFAFQKGFLKPFNTFISQSPSVEIRELVIRCLGNIVAAKAPNIKSGWPVIIRSLSRSAGDSSEVVVMLAFETLDSITSEFMMYLTAPDVFADVLNAYASFAANRVNVVKASQSIAYLQFCALVALHGCPMSEHPFTIRRREIRRDGTDPSEEAASLSKMYLESLEQPTGRDSDNLKPILVKPDGSLMERDAEMQMWLSVFSGFGSLLTSGSTPEIRTQALKTLFSTLHLLGHIFQPNEWQLVLAGTVYPVFDSVFCDIHLMARNASFALPDSQSNAAHGTDYTWQVDIVQDGLYLLFELFSSFYAILRPLFADFINIIFNCIRKQDRKVADLGLAKLKELLQEGKLGGKEMAPQEWELLSTRITALVDSCLPHSLLTLMFDESTRRLCIAVGNIGSHSSTSRVMSPGQSTPSEGGRIQVEPLNANQVIVSLQTLTQVARILTGEMLKADTLIPQGCFSLFVQSFQQCATFLTDALGHGERLLLLQRAPQLHMLLVEAEKNVITVCVHALAHLSTDVDLLLVWVTLVFGKVLSLRSAAHDNYPDATDIPIPNSTQMLQSVDNTTGPAFRLELQAMLEVTIAVLDRLVQLEDAAFVAIVAKAYPLLVDLVAMHDAKVCAAAAPVLMRVGRCFHVLADDAAMSWTDAVAKAMAERKMRMPTPKASPQTSPSRPEETEDRAAEPAPEPAVASPTETEAAAIEPPAPPQEDVPVAQDEPPVEAEPQPLAAPEEETTTAEAPVEDPEVVAVAEPVVDGTVEPVAEAAADAVETEEPPVPEEPVPAADDVLEAAPAVQDEPEAPTADRPEDHSGGGQSKSKRRRSKKH